MYNYSYILENEALLKKQKISIHSIWLNKKQPTIFNKAPACNDAFRALLRFFIFEWSVTTCKDFFRIGKSKRKFPCSS